MNWMDFVAVLALVLGLAGLGWGIWNWQVLRALGLGLGGRAGPLPARLETVGRRMEALERRRDGLEEMLGRVGVRPAALSYAPLGLGGARRCFVLALLNREGNGVVLNYLSGTAIRLDLKEVGGWKSLGQALTPEEEQAVEAARKAWGL